MADGYDLTHQPGLPTEEIAKRYTEWAKGAKYDWDLREENYQGPDICVSTVLELFPEERHKTDINILDVAAGSGFVGEKLKLKGFQKVDALEPSEGMLQLAIEKKIYKKTYNAFLCPDSGVPSNLYDVAVISGGMGEGHIPSAACEDLIRMVKEGGYVVIVMREMYLTSVAEYRDRLEPMMSEWEKQGKWSLVRRTVVPKYSYNTNNGVVFLYKVTETSG